MKKNYNNSILFSLLLLIIAGCGHFRCNKNEPTGTTRWDIQTTVNGDLREYIMYVPSHYDGQTPWPLVFQLHGGSGNGEKFYNISGWNDLAEEHSFLVAYPTSWRYDVNENGCGNALTTRWHNYNLEDEICPGEQMRDDVAFFDQMIDEITGQFAVDTDRIYVSGFSNGAGMTSRLAVELSDRLAAVGILAGSLPNDPDTSYIPVRMLPIQIMIGTLDDRILEKTDFTNEIPMDFALAFGDSAFSGIIDTWTTTFDLDPNYVVSDSTGKTITATFNGNSADPEHLMKFTLVEGLEHKFANPKNRPGVADMFWDFFRPDSLPGSAAPAL